MEIIILAILIGLIPASIARSKGASFIGWWFYGTMLFIIALPHALIMKKDMALVERRLISEEGMKKCPFCAELIKNDAKICRFCQRESPMID